MEGHGAHDLPALAGCHLQPLPLERQQTAVRRRLPGAKGRRLPASGLRRGESFVDGETGFPPRYPSPKLDEFPQTLSHSL